MESRTFSLIVCTIGRTDVLTRLLNSLACQHLETFEVIVVDQNPEGFLEPIIEPFKAQLAIRHVRADRGLSRSRNIGIRLSSGDYLSFPDDDCWYGPDVLACVARQFEEQPDRDLILGRTVDQNGHASLSMSRQTSGPITKTNVWISGNSSTLFVRRRVIELIGDFDEELGIGAQTVFQSGEETDFILRALERNLTAFYDSNLLVNHPQIDVGSRTQLSRARKYSVGFGYVLRKHRYGSFYLLYRIGRSAGRSIGALLMLDLGQAKYKALWAVGTIKGYFAKSRNSVVESVQGTELANARLNVPRKGVAVRQMLDSMRARLSLLRTHPLARRQQLRTLARFAKAEILNRAIGRSFLFRHDFGVTLIVDRHLHSSRGHYFFGVHEFDEELFLIHFLQPKELFIDVGANLGVFSILVARTTGAKVIAFEPSPHSATVMRKQIALNKLEDRIQLIQACAGDSSCEAAIQNSVRMDNSVILGKCATSPNVVTVPMVMIDDIVRPQVPCVMKMDVEGFERQALEGALRLLGNSALRALIIETRDICTRFGENATKIVEIITSHGFHPARYDPLARALTPAGCNDESSAHDVNIIYVRDFNEAQHRLSSAPRRQIFGLPV